MVPTNMLCKDSLSWPQTLLIERQYYDFDQGLGVPSKSENFENDFFLGQSFAIGLK